MFNSLIVEFFRLSDIRPGLALFSFCLYLFSILFVFCFSTRVEYVEATEACFRGTTNPVCSYPSTRPKCRTLHP